MKIREWIIEARITIETYPKIKKRDIMFRAISFQLGLKI
jgi:hypothetical protein